MRGGRKSIKFNQMKATKLNKLKPSYDSLRIIGRVMYEATGSDYWAGISCNVGVSCAMGCNFFEMYWQVYNNAKKQLSKIDCFSYNLVKLNGNKVPFLYNQI